MFSQDAVPLDARRELEQITLSSDSDERLSFNERSAQQATAGRKVGTDYEMALELVKPSNGDSKFNCYRFALGLDHLPEPIHELVFSYGGKGIGRISWRS